VAAMKSGDGWIVCDAGHRHWGVYGAAGVLVAEDARVILQHRAPWTHQGDTWGVLGGARHAGEDAVTAALREAQEEADIDPELIQPIGTYLDDHGGWSYTTVVARPRAPLYPTATNAESVTVEWVPIDAVQSLTLHDGFARAWPLLSDIPATLHLVISAELYADPLTRDLATAGIAVDRLPSRIRYGSLGRLLPQIHFASSPKSAVRQLGIKAAGDQVVLVADQEGLRLLA
jgi:8-oxo-dGTP diphosphatase